MKKIKILGVLCTVVLLMLVFSVGVFAADFRTECNSTAHRGEEIVVNVFVDDPVNIKAGAIGFNYDSSALKLVSGEWRISSPLISHFDMSKGIGVFTYLSDTEIKGELFTATFKVLDNAKIAKTTIDVEVKFGDVNMEIVNKSVSVSVVKDGSSSGGGSGSSGGSSSVHVHVLGAEATCTTPQICTTCNAVIKQAKGHVLGFEANCKTGQICLSCGFVAVEPLGHSFGEWQVVKEATETEDGAKERTCSRCSEVETATIEKLGAETEAATSESVEETNDDATVETTVQTAADTTATSGGCGATLSLSAISFVMALGVSAAFARKREE